MISLPEYREIEIRGFSLYDQENVISITVQRGVHCLAGANGIGKSTFLSALNYAITGKVPKPDRDFVSAREYFEENDFYKSYFDGRINQGDRDRACISVTFQINGVTFQVERNLFEPDALRSLAIGEKNYNDSVDTEEDLNSIYKRRITDCSGLKMFESFVFIHHYILTFDESRHLLLWDKKALTQALYICIGADLDKATLSEDVRRKMERAASRARNARFQATKVVNRIADIRDETEFTDIDIGQHKDTIDRYKRLIKKRSKIDDRISEYQKMLSDTREKIESTSSKITSLKHEYDLAFDKLVGGTDEIQLHPLIQQTISSGQCQVCGQETGVNQIRDRIDQCKCPLCNSSVEPESGDDSRLNELKQMDELLNTLNQEISVLYDKKDRIRADIEDLKEQQSSVLKDINTIKDHNRAVIDMAMSGETSSIADTIHRLQEEVSELEAEKTKHYERRDRYQAQLLQLNSELRKKYRKAEDEFVPIFQRLARLFLGLDVRIELDVDRTKTSPGLLLVVEVEGQKRRNIHQLSESQRFFIDIALRMALAQHVSTGNGGATLFIDTPEGSLDITYEDRAGQMFGEFVNNGHNIIMTANINSSRILLALAEQCGNSSMVVERMTQWASLSEVQRQGEELFSDAFRNIEETLAGSQ